MLQGGFHGCAGVWRAEEGEWPTEGPEETKAPRPLAKETLLRLLPWQRQVPPRAWVRKIARNARRRVLVGLWRPVRGQNTVQAKEWRTGRGAPGDPAAGWSRPGSGNESAEAPGTVGRTDL